jgi:ectoine hydroxylase-related dioxygenase (phytanoyl-CoA dioxygenase family)
MTVETILPMPLEEIKTAFARDGFVLLKQVIFPAELAALRADTNSIIEGGYQNKPNPSDYFWDKDPITSEEVFHRVQYVFSKETPHNSLLILLANPLVLQIVRYLLGEDFLCAAEALVFKMPTNGRVVPVHADCNAADQRISAGHLTFNVDYYLDDSTPENGCLLVAPGSHKLRVSREEATRAGFDFPGLVEMPVQAGDILLHDIKLIHGSHRSSSPKLRRTLYYEFDSIRWLAQEGSRPEYPITEQWIEDRIRLLMRAIDLRKKAGYALNEQPFDYSPPAGHPLTWPSLEEAVNLRPAMGYNKYF